jgi:hypothetical protein
MRGTNSRLNGDAALGERLDDVALGGGLQEADENRALLEEVHLGGIRRLDLENDVRVLQQAGRALDNLDARLLVGLVGHEGGRAGAFLHAHLEPSRNKLGCRVRDERHPSLILSTLLGDCDPHSLRTVTEMAAAPAPLAAIGDRTLFVPNRRVNF